MTIRHQSSTNYRLFPSYRFFNNIVDIFLMGFLHNIISSNNFFNVLDHVF